MVTLSWGITKVITIHPEKDTNACKFGDNQVVEICCIGRLRCYMYVEIYQCVCENLAGGSRWKISGSSKSSTGHYGYTVCTKRHGNPFSSSLSKDLSFFLNITLQILDVDNKYTNVPNFIQRSIFYIFVLRRPRKQLLGNGQQGLIVTVLTWSEYGPHISFFHFWTCNT